MKTIRDFEGAEFLRRCNRIRHGIEAALKSLDISEIRKRRPVFTGEETDEQRAAMTQAQAAMNLNAILDKALEEKPDETLKLIRLFVECEPGEPEPDGMTLVFSALDVLTDKRVLDFLLRLMRSGLIDMQS